MTALGLLCFAQSFSSCSEWGLCSKQGLLIGTVHRLLIAVASLVEHRIWGAQASVVAAHRPSSCGSQALEHARYGSCNVRPGSCNLWSLERRLSSAWIQLLCGMWNLPRQGIEPMSPASTGIFLYTTPLRKFQN